MVFKYCVRKKPRAPSTVLYKQVLYNQHAVCKMTEPTFNIALPAERMINYVFSALVLTPPILLSDYLTSTDQ